MTFRFIPNPAGIARIDETAEMSEAMKVYGEATVQVAQAIAPRLTGAYADSIQAVSETVNGQSVCQVVADIEYAVFVEFGTSDTPAFAPLRRASEATHDL